VTPGQQIERPVPTGSELWPVGRLLSAAARRVEREWDAHLATWGLTHASLPVLIHLLGGPLSQREVAERCGVREQTMSRVVERAERMGFLSRHQHERDRRQHVLALTDAGRGACLAATDPAVSAHIVTRGLTDEQAADLARLLALVVRPDDGPGGGGGPGGGPGAGHHRAAGLA